MSDDGKAHDEAGVIHSNEETTAGEAPEVPSPPSRTGSLTLPTPPVSPDGDGEAAALTATTTEVQTIGLPAGVPGEPVMYKGFSWAMLLGGLAWSNFFFTVDNDFRKNVSAFATFKTLRAFIPPTIMAIAIANFGLTLLKNLVQPEGTGAELVGLCVASIAPLIILPLYSSAPQRPIGEFSMGNKDLLAQQDHPSHELAPVEGHGPRGNLPANLLNLDSILRTFHSGSVLCNRGDDGDDGGEDYFMELHPPGEDKLDRTMVYRWSRTYCLFIAFATISFGTAVTLTGISQWNKIDELLEADPDALSPIGFPLALGADRNIMWAYIVTSWISLYAIFASLSLTRLTMDVLGRRQVALRDLTEHLRDTSLLSEQTIDNVASSLPGHSHKPTNDPSLHPVVYKRDWDEARGIWTRDVVELEEERRLVVVGDMQIRFNEEYDYYSRSMGTSLMGLLLAIGLVSMSYLMTSVINLSTLFYSGEAVDLNEWPWINLGYSLTMFLVIYLVFDVASTVHKAIVDTSAVLIHMWTVTHVSITFVRRALNGRARTDESREHLFKHLIALRHQALELGMLKGSVFTDTEQGLTVWGTAVSTRFPCFLGTLYVAVALLFMLFVFFTGIGPIELTEAAAASA